MSEAVGYLTPQDINMNVMTYTQQRAELCGSSPVPAGIGACSDSYTTWAQHSPLVAIHTDTNTTRIHIYTHTVEVHPDPAQAHTCCTTLKVWDMHDYIHHARRSRGGGGGGGEGEAS